MTATASINLRTSDAEKSLIDQAAQSMGKSRTAFILENTLRVAEEVILDRTRFTLDVETWGELQAAGRAAVRGAGSRVEQTVCSPSSVAETMTVTFSALVPMTAAHNVSLFSCGETAPRGRVHEYMKMTIERDAIRI